MGMPRRYYATRGNYQFIPPSAYSLNTFISVAALRGRRGAAAVHLYNLAWSLLLRAGAPMPQPLARRPRWNGRRRTRRRCTATSAPELPVVYRWAYGYGVPAGSPNIPQTWRAEVPQNEPGAEAGGAGWNPRLTGEDGR
jgi:cytochrome c oxidase subunit 1